MQVGIRKVALHFTLYYMAESTLVVDLRIRFETKPDMMQMWRKPTGADTSHRCEHRWLIDLVAVEQCDSRHTVDSKVSDTFNSNLAQRKRGQASESEKPGVVYVWFHFTQQQRHDQGAALR